MSRDIPSQSVDVPWSLKPIREAMYAPALSGELIADNYEERAGSHDPASAPAMQARSRKAAAADSESPYRRQPNEDAEEIFKRHLPIIGQIALSVCRRHGVGDHDAEDFTSDVLLKLCDDNYAVIRKFQNRSSFATYLTVVINKTFLDHRRRLWGKWTPSAQAKRFGTIGVQLEKLVYRDRHSFDAACEMLAQKYSVTRALQTLREMFAELPRRSPPRQMEGGYEIKRVRAVDESDTG